MLRREEQPTLQRLRLVPPIQTAAAAQLLIQAQVHGRDAQHAGGTPGGFVEKIRRLEADQDRILVLIQTAATDPDLNQQLNLNLNHCKHF